MLLQRDILNLSLDAGDVKINKAVSVVEKPRPVMKITLQAALKKGAMCGHEILQPESCGAVLGWQDLPVCGMSRSLSG
jgi:hypothetical protein